MTVLSSPSPRPLATLTIEHPDAPVAETGTEWPRIDVLVAYRDEAGLIAQKVRNLRGLDYPNDRLRFVMIDGGSRDRSEQIGRAAAGGDSRFRWLNCRRGGKTRQLNLGFARFGSPWILVSDADARLPRSVLRQMVRVARSDATIGLVGTRCHPRRASAFERIHWHVWNAIRRVEARFGCATALGPCYLLRRDGFGGWPDDVVADDVYASLETNRMGSSATMVRALVVERRSPSGMHGFLWHKVRKVLAVLREFLRFVPRAAEFQTLPRLVLLARSLAIVLGPLFILACCSAIAMTVPVAAIALAALVALSFAVPVGVRVAHRITKPFRMVGLMVTLSGVLVASMLIYPFVRPRAVFCRWNQEEF